MIFEVTPLTTRSQTTHLSFRIQGTALSAFIHRLRSSANFSFVCNRGMRLQRPIALSIHRGAVRRVLRCTFNRRTVAFGVSNARVLLKRHPISHGCAIDKCVASSVSSRALVNTGVLRSDYRAKASAGPFKFCDLALPRKRAKLFFSCLKCRAGRYHFLLDQSAMVGVHLRAGGRLSRVVILSSGGRANVQTANVNALSVPVARVGGAPTVLKRTSVLGAVRLVPNMRTKARNFDKLCMQNNKPSRGLVLLSNVPVCGTSRVLNIFSVFAPRTVGGIALFGNSFPTHCNNHLSSVISVQAGSNSVRGCRNAIDVNLLADGLRFRNPVLGSGASFYLANHHACLSLMTEPFLPRSGGCGCCFCSVGAGIGRGFSSHDHLFLDFCGKGSRCSCGRSGRCSNCSGGCKTDVCFCGDRVSFG